MKELGALLHEARIRKGLTLEDVEEQTRIRTQYLEAIEAGDPDSVPGEAYFRAFLRSYAKVVDIDPQQMMAQYDLIRLPQEPQEKPSLRERREAARKKKRIRALILAGVCGMVILALYLLWTLGYLPV